MSYFQISLSGVVTFSAGAEAPGIGSSRFTAQYGQKFGALFFPLKATAMAIVCPSLLQHFGHFTENWRKTIALPNSTAPIIAATGG